MGLGRYVWMFVVSVLLNGCFGNEATNFPEGLEPIEEMPLAEPPMATETEPLPLTPTIEAGELREYDWAYLSGWVDAPIADVYTAMQNQDGSVDRRAVSSWSVRPSQETQYTHGWIAHAVVNDVITVEFDVTWRLGIASGTEDHPRVAVAKFQKTDGTTAIQYLVGSVVATDMGNGVTRIDVMNRVKAFRRGANYPTQFVSDYYASILALVHGQPLPTWR